VAAAAASVIRRHSRPRSRACPTSALAELGTRWKAPLRIPDPIRWLRPGQALEHHGGGLDVRDSVGQHDKTVGRHYAFLRIRPERPARIGDAIADLHFGDAGGRFPRLFRPLQCRARSAKLPDRG
jgi:hypothetical protein